MSYKEVYEKLKEEKYLCASCLYCFEFFDLFCSQTEEECPSGCIECEYYVEVKE